MNKLFTKVAALTLGVAMAAGVGVALGSAKASEAKAGISSTPTWSYDNASFGSSYAHGTQTLNDVDWYLSCACNATIGWNTSTQGGNNDASMAPLSTIAETTKYGAYQASGGWQVGKFVVSIANTQDSVAGTWYIWYSSDNGVNWTQATTGTLSSDTTELAYDHGSNFSTATRFAFGFGASKTTKVRITINEIAVYSYTDGNTYTVTNSVEHGSVSPTSVNEGETLTATITPDTGYELPATLTDVTMGGNSVVYSYNAGTGVVTVNNVSGDIVISGSCPEKQAPQPVDLPDGDYTATLAYANPFPTEIDVLDGQSAKVATLTSSVSAVKSYDDTHHEYVLAKDAYFEINNLTNGVIKSISFNLYQYRNMNVFVDDSTTAVYTGDGQKGSGDPVVVEVETNAQSKIKVVSNGGTGSYDLKMYSLDLNIKVGTAVTPVTGVSLNAQSGKIAVGTTRQLTATVAPSSATNKNVSWSAEPESVATVSSSGLVTGVSAGEAVITVTTEDGGFTASYTATVGVPNYGTENAPLTVEEAREALEYTDATVTSSKLYVYGKVYSSKYSGTSYNDYTIWLTNSDESVDKYFEIYQGEISEAITSDDTADDALKGETVICHGYGKVHNGSTFELLKANDEKPSVAKYEAPQPVQNYTVTYTAGQGTGDNYVVSDVEAGSSHALVTFETAEFTAPEGQEFKGWQVGNDAELRDPGYVLENVAGDVTVTAIYVNKTQTDWTDAQKTVLETALHGYLPPFFGELVEDLTTTENGATFTVSGDLSEVFATKLGDGWDLVGENNYMMVGDNYYLTASIDVFGVRGLPVGDYSTISFTYHEGNTWSAALLSQFATVLHGVVPSYDDSVSTLTYYANYKDFEMAATDQATAQAQLDTLCANWEYYEAGGFYYEYSQDQLGYVRGYLYKENDTYSATLMFVQTAYDEDQQYAFYDKLGVVPPFFTNFATYTYYETDGMFVTDQITYLDYLSDYQDEVTSYGFTLISQSAGQRYVKVAEEAMDGTVYAYGALLQDGGILVVEIFAFYNYYLSINIYYQAQPVSIALSGEFKTTFEYGEQFDTTGMVVTATMSDETEQDVTSSAQFSGFDSLVEGEQTVTVTVGSVSTTYTVTVNEKVLQKIDVTSEPTKVVYKVGEEFDPEGLEVTATYNGGDPVVLDLADVEISGFDSSTTGEKTVTVAFGGKTASFTVTVEQGYDADTFAKELLEMVAPICENYDGKKNNKVALKTVWDTMSQRYSTLSNEEKAKVIAAAAKTDGTDLEKAMAFYNYACKKYGLTKFIEGRQVKALVAEHETGNSILPIVVIVASSVAAITAIGVVIALKRRKALLAK